MYVANPGADANPFLYRILRPAFRSLSAAGTGQVWFATAEKPKLVDGSGNVTAGRLTFDYAATTGSDTRTPLLDLGTSPVWNSPGRLLRLDFDVDPAAWPQAAFAIDAIELLPDVAATGVWLSPTRIRVSLSGDSFPMLAKSIALAGWKLSGLPSGVSLESVTRLDYATADLELTSGVSDSSTRAVTVSVAASQFIEPFARMIGNRDLLGRTPAEEASAAGTTLVQTGYRFESGVLTGSVKKSATTLPTDAPPTPTPTMTASPQPTRKPTATPAADATTSPGSTTPGTDATPGLSPTPSPTPGGGPQTASDGIPPYLFVLGGALLFAGAMVFLAVRRAVSPSGRKPSRP
jgi:hypothetical protein